LIKIILFLSFVTTFNPTAKKLDANMPFKEFGQVGLGIQMRIEIKLFSLVVELIMKFNPASIGEIIMTVHYWVFLAYILKLFVS